MKTLASLAFFLSILLWAYPNLSAKDLPKIVVWDLIPRNIKHEYAHELTSILVSELAKWKTYEVYSQENVRTIAGWTAERMKLGCTDTQCLLALGQMDVAKLVSGSVGKIGETYSISLGLFDTQNAKADHAVSEFCSSENELISLVQKAVHQLFSLVTGAEGAPRKGEMERIYKNSIGMEFQYIAAGKFIMGSLVNPMDSYGSEVPIHEVEISKSFYFGKYEVTQSQWLQIMGNNPSYFRNCGENCPVEQVTWNQAQEFLRRLNQKENTNKYRLPTEAEWEYACRAGSRSTFGFGDDIQNLEEYGWYVKNSGGSVRPVGQKRPNAWGLYDLNGNVWEWCSDWFDAEYYGKSTPVNPPGPDAGYRRILRGGSWLNYPGYLRCATRYSYDPSQGFFTIGLRIAREMD
jgi:formylglycine-generating enzyme required for sulfatase activity